MEANKKRINNNPTFPYTNYTVLRHRFFLFAAADVSRSCLAVQDKQGEHNISDVEIYDFTGANKSRGTREVRDEKLQTKTLSFRFNFERCCLMRVG